MNYYILPKNNLNTEIFLLLKEEPYIPYISYSLIYYLNDIYKNLLKLDTNCLSEDHNVINIEYIISQYEEEKHENSPNYIIEFFTNIKFTIEQCKDKHSKNNILKKYDDKEYFMLELEKRLKISINRYLGINDDE